jgi:hypothetical protein
VGRWFGVNSGEDLIQRVRELEIQISSLRDRRDVSDLYHRYMRGFDRNDRELLRGTFWPDAQINYPDQINTPEEFIERHLDLHVRELRSWGHLLTNESVEIEGDVAHCEVYVTALFMPLHERSFVGPSPTIVGGRYVDRLDRRDGTWRISVREFAGHFTTNLGIDALISGADRHVWDRGDISYLRPLTPKPRAV